MSEPLTTEAEDQEIELEAEETSETASETGENQGEKTEDELAKLQAAVRQKAFEEREAKREAERLRKQNEELMAKLPQEKRPAIPPIPDDPFADNFAEMMAQRDKAIQEAAAFDAREAERKRIEDERNRQIQEEQQKSFQALVQKYVSNAENVGISRHELDGINERVNAHMLDDQIANHIMDDPQGPLIASYLDKNILEIDAIKSMPVSRAAIYIENVIKPRAAQLTKKITEAPDPVEPLKGSGVREERGPKGATYE